MDDKKKTNRTKVFLDKQPYKNRCVVEENEEAPTFFDFDMLAQGPVMQGNYFQFKHDKYFMPDADKLELDEMFRMDLGRISLAMQAVPFYERIGIDKNLLGEEEVNHMNEEAKRYKIMYQASLDSKNETDTSAMGDRHSFFQEELKLIPSISKSMRKSLTEKIVKPPKHSNAIAKEVEVKDKSPTKSLTQFKRLGKNTKDLPPACLLRKEAKPFDANEILPDELQVLPSTSSLSSRHEQGKLYMDIVNSEKAASFPRLTESQEKLFPKNEVDELEDWLDDILD